MRKNIVHHQLQTLDSPSAITFSTERQRMLVPRSFIAQNAPTESCRCATRIPWYHQNPAYTHRILFALTACSCCLFYTFAERSEGQIVTCPWACGGCDTKMCCTRIIQCQQKFCPRVIRSRPTAYLSTSLKLRTYLNLRTCVLKFKYANFALSPTTKT